MKIHLYTLFCYEQKRKSEQKRVPAKYGDRQVTYRVCMLTVARIDVFILMYC